MERFHVKVLHRTINANKNLYFSECILVFTSTCGKHTCDKGGYQILVIVVYEHYFSNFNWFVLTVYVLLHISKFRVSRHLLN